MDNTLFAKQVGYKVRNLLLERKAIVRPEARKFTLWARSDRLVVILNADAISVEKINRDFAHILTSRLQGRMTIITNHRGVCLQVGYGIPIAPRVLKTLPLDLTAQPTPYHIPVGETSSGALWIDLLEADSIFLAGIRGTGKSNMVHGFIQALLNGGKVEIHAWDGKNHAEFLRYQDRDNFIMYPQAGLGDGLRALHKEAMQRLSLFAPLGVTNLIAYNADSKNDFIKPIAFILDEVAEVKEKEYVNQLVKLFRASGIYPIFATNEPKKSEVLAKSNLSTRICLHVGSAYDSVTAYGHTGAQLIPNVPGRGLIQQSGRDVEFQAYLAPLDMPTPEAVAWHIEHIKSMAAEITQPTRKMDTTREKAEAIRDQWKKSMSKSTVARLLGLPQYGGSYVSRVDAVIEYLSTISTPTIEEVPVLPVLDMVSAR